MFRTTRLCRLAGAMTSAEKKTALRNANEQMKAYYEQRPPIATVKPKKNFGDSPRDYEHLLQGAIVVSFLAAFLSTPFLGRKIAQDKEFRESFIPKWYDFTLEKPKYAWTREEHHEQLMKLQKELHERAIAGEFTPEKLDQMRRHFAGVDPANDPHGWGQLHPGVDDDEDVEDD